MELELQETQIALYKQTEKNKRLMAENRKLKQEIARINHDLINAETKAKRPNNQRPTVITPETVTRVLGFRDRKISPITIAKETGISRSTVYKIIKQYG